MEEPSFLNQQERVRIHNNRLPHWEQDDCTYFLSFRLADSLPENLLAEWKEERILWLRAHPQPWSEELQREYQELFSRRREAWIDQGHGACPLRDCGLRTAVQKAIFDRAQADAIWSLVLMPNHAHALVSLADCRDGAIGRLMKRWKGATARTANGIRGIQGAFWAKDYFDRLIRDRRHFLNCVRYIRNNPEKARLRNEEFTLWEHPHVRGLLDA